WPPLAAWAGRRTGSSLVRCLERPATPWPPRDRCSARTCVPPRASPSSTSLARALARRGGPGGARPASEGDGARREVVVHEPARLHRGVGGRRPDEPEPELLERLRQRGRLGRGARDVSPCDGAVGPRRGRERPHELV